MFKKIVPILTASLIAFAFSGCSKKPQRPNPYDTVMGGGYDSGSRTSDFNPTTLQADGDLPQIRNTAGWDSSSLDDLIANADRGMFDPVLFQFDSSAIAPSERPTLQAAADYLSSNPNAKIILEGHCDWRGTQEYNLALGDRRAKSALDFIITMGIDPNRLKTLSQGDLQAVEGASSAQMTSERRVELLVIR